MVSLRESDPNESTLETESLEQLFSRCRPRLLRAAYRMVGTFSDGEDILQEAFLRMRTIDLNSVVEKEAYLLRVVSRLCLDHLKSARARRESYVGPWLPEPIVGLSAGDEAPERTAEMAGVLHDDVSMALLVALESLSPLERAAFLLHDVFDLEYGEIADVLERSEEACRALAGRGRKQIRTRRPRFPASRQGAERLVAAFWRSIVAGDVQALSEVLTADAQLVPDGGGRVAAATRIVRGADRVARFLVGGHVRVRARAEFTVEFLSVGGQPGLMIRLDGKIAQVSAFEFEGDRIAVIYAVRNPDKLAHLGAVVAGRACRN